MYGLLERILKIGALLALPCATALAASPVLRTMMQEGSAPKYFLQDGAPAGHCPDILRALERADPQLRIDIDVRPSSIRRMEDHLKAGHIDLICGLLETPLRNGIAYRIPTPVYFVRERLVGRRDDALKVNTVQDLAQAGDWVATQSGASYAEALRSVGVKVDDSSGDSAQALRNVANKRVRFYYTNELTAAYYIKLGDWDKQLAMLPVVLQQTPSYLWASRQLDADTVERLERAMAKLNKDGVLKRIYLNYAGP